MEFNSGFKGLNEDIVILN